MEGHQSHASGMLMLFLGCVLFIFGIGNHCLLVHPLPLVRYYKIVTDYKLKRTNLNASQIMKYKSTKTCGSSTIGS